MALNTTMLPFGLREVKISPIDDSGTVGTAVKLPNAQTFSFGETEEYETLRGDDGVVAVRGNGAVVKWTLEAGGINLNAWVVLAGGSNATTGTTPNQVKTFSKVKTSGKPYFKTEGRAISDSGGDMHAVVYKCRCTGNLEGEFADGKFWISKCDGDGVPDTNDKLYDFVQNETAAAIA